MADPFQPNLPLQPNVFKATEESIKLNFQHVLIEGKWYFWDEHWSGIIGPYDSKKEADVNFQFYCKEVLKCGGCED